MESLAYSILLSPVAQGQTVNNGMVLRHLSWTAIGSTASLVIASTTLPAAAIVGQGATCSDTVRQIQTALSAKDYSVGVDGVFGTNTYNAIVRFQQAQNLQADGVVGAKTAAALGLSGEVYTAATNCGTPASSTSTATTSSSTATSSTATSADQKQYTVTAEALNVRSAPNLTAEVVDVLFKDAQVEGTESEPGWLKIADGKWVATRFVAQRDNASPSNSATSSTVTSSTPTGAGQKQYTVTAEALNVRSAPNPTAEVVEVLFKDAPIGGTESEPGWLKIADGKWVSAQFVQQLGSQDASSSSASQNAASGESDEGEVVINKTIIEAETLDAAFASGFVRVSADALNVRTGPASTYDVVGYVAGGELLPLSGRATEDGWIQVAWGDWISSAFVEPVEADAVEQIASTADDQSSADQVETIDIQQLDAALTDQVQVTAENLNVRSGPGTSYSVVGSLIRDDVVPLSGKATEDGWIQLTWGDWISSAFVNPVVIRDQVES